MQFTGADFSRMFVLAAGLNGLASAACGGSAEQNLPYEQIIAGNGAKLDCSKPKFATPQNEFYGADQCVDGFHSVPPSDFDPQPFVNLNNCVFGGKLLTARLPEEGTEEGKVGPKFGTLYLGGVPHMDAGLTPIFEHGHSYSMVATTTTPACFVGLIVLHESMHSLQAVTAYHLWASRQSSSDAQEPPADFSTLGHGLDASGHTSPGTPGIMTAKPGFSCPATFSEDEALAILNNLEPAGLADALGEDPKAARKDLLKRMTDVTACQDEWMAAVTAMPR